MVKHLIQIKNGIMTHVNASVKSITRVKQYYSWNPSTCICEKSVHLKTIADILVNMCDEFINATDNVFNSMTNTIPINMRNTILTNIMNTMSTNSDDKK